jgi:hypothetical protein
MWLWMTLTGCALSTAVVVPTPAATDPTPAALSWADDNPAELGRVRWERDYAAGLQRARAEGKPALLLFDEVPGCSTVLAFGRGPLSHPLLVDAAEALFVPIVVYNNVGGDDRRVLERWDEPAWNNPVVRFVDADEREVAPRLTDRTTAAVAEHMVEALGDAAPAWLTLLAQEERAAQRGTDTATFSMACFWSGEGHLGRPEGVVGTQTGFVGGREVVEVTYDPQVLSRAALDAHAARGNAAVVHGGELRPSPGDDRYGLRHTAWRHVPMTSAQASRANAEIRAGRDPSGWFSPRQVALYQLASAHPEAGWPDDMGRSELGASFDQALSAAGALGR